MLEVNQVQDGPDAPGPTKTYKTGMPSPQAPSIHLVGSHLRIHIPMTFKKKSGRKVIILPEGYREVTATADPQENPRDNLSIQKPLAIAVALGHRWLGLLMEGKFLSVNDLAETIPIDPSLLRRHLNLTCLPPRLILAILDGKEPEGMSLAGMKDGAENSW